MALSDINSVLVLFSSGVHRPHSKWLSSNARFQKSWEQMAFAKLDNAEQENALASFTLLRIYWTWQAPLYDCVYRNCKLCKLVSHSSFPIAS